MRTMARRWPMRPKRSLKENALSLIPALFDDFTSGQEVVLTHPRTIDALHRMRIAGKPLRYVMELTPTGFGKPFAACLEELKVLLEELGNVHDSDVAIKRLRDYIGELQIFNSAVRDRRQTFRLKPVRTILASTRAARNRHYRLVCAILRRWKRTRFRTRLVASISRAQPRSRTPAGRVHLRRRRQKG